MPINGCYSHLLVVTVKLDNQSYPSGYSSMPPATGNPLQHRTPLAQVAGPAGHTQYMLDGEDPIPIVPMTQSTRHGADRHLAYSQHIQSSTVSQENNAPLSQQASSVHVQQPRSDPMSAAASVSGI